MRISDWSADVCSSDLTLVGYGAGTGGCEEDVDNAAIHSHHPGLFLEDLLTAIARLNGAADGGKARAPIAGNWPAHLLCILRPEHLDDMPVDSLNLQGFPRARRAAGVHVDVCLEVRPALCLKFLEHERKNDVVGKGWAVRV